MKIPKVEYDVYAKLNGGRLIKLNIASVCENIKINIIYPVDIKERTDKYNNNSDYCNNKCYISSSEDGVDITLKDRQKECANNTVCQEDCSFDNYNIKSKKVNCSCIVKERSKSFVNMTINKDKLLANFKHIKNIANIGILSCIKNLFCKNGIIKNIAFYIIMVIILFHNIAIFIFCLRKKDSLNRKIKEIIFAIKNIKLLNIKRKTTKNIIKTKENKTNNINNQISKLNNTNIEIIKEGNKISKKKKGKGKGKLKFNKNKNNEKEEDKSIHLNINNNIIDNNILAMNNKNKNKKNRKSIISENTSKANINKENIIQNIKKILEYNDDEINELPYEEALQNDSRTYCLYYLSLMRSKHSLYSHLFIKRIIIKKKKKLIYFL